MICLRGVVVDRDLVLESGGVAGLAFSELIRPGLANLGVGLQTRHVGFHDKVQGRQNLVFRHVQSHAGIAGENTE